MMVADDEGLSESLLLLLLSLYTLTPRPYIFNKRSDAVPHTERLLYVHSVRVYDV